MRQSRLGQRGGTCPTVDLGKRDGFLLIPVARHASHWVNHPVPIVLRQANVGIVEQRNQDERGGLNRQLVPPLGVGHDQRPRERRRVPVEEKRMAEGKHIIAPCCLN